MFVFYLVETGSIFTSIEIRNNPYDYETMNGFVCCMCHKTFQNNFVIPDIYERVIPYQ